MLLKMTVNNKSNAFQGYATLKLDFSKNIWSVEQDPKQVWSKVGSGIKGSFEAKNWGVIYVQDPLEKSRLLAIIQTAPKDGGDTSRKNGVARLYQPLSTDYQDASCQWQIDTTTPAPAAPAKPLPKIRQKLVDAVTAKFNPKGKMFTHGPTSFDKVLANFTFERKSDNKIGGYTNCGAMASWVSKQLGRGAFLTIESVWKMKEAKAPGWVLATGDNLPRPGDVYALAKANGKFSHVGMVVSATRTLWETADTGQAPDGFSGGRHDRSYDASKNMIAGEVVQGGEMRSVAGWMNINTKGLFKEADGVD